MNREEILKAGLRLGKPTFIAAEVFADMLRTLEGRPPRVCEFCNKVITVTWVLYYVGTYQEKNACGDCVHNHRTTPRALITAVRSHEQEKP